MPFTAASREKGARADLRIRADIPSGSSAEEDLEA